MINALYMSPEEKEKLESAIERYLSYLRNRKIREAAVHITGAGSKRLRSTLLVLAYKAVGGKSIDDVIPFAAAVEFIHNWALVHDDILDESDVRRGVPAVHIKWGKKVAMLVGNALDNLPYFILKDVAIDKEMSNKAIGTLAEASLELIEGQVMDIDFETRMDVSESDYLDMVKKKTGALIKCALKIGGILGTRDEEKIRALEQYGELIGIAFNIQDDLLDIVGDEEKLGKKIGRDIKQGKKTLVVIHALANAKSGDVDRLKAILGNKRSSVEDIQEAIRILKGARCIDYARRVIQESTMKAKSTLKALSNEEYENVLSNLADFLANRQL
jgi:geranylgeranyl diphosphate synthase type I